ncbi:MAG: ROK family protein [bacterium]
MAANPVEAVLAVHVDHRIRAQVVGRDAIVYRSIEQATPVAGGAAEVIEAVRGAARNAASGRRTRLVGVGLAVPGIVDSARGIARHSSLIGWHNVALGDLLQGDLATAVGVDQDVRAAALAEGANGAARGCSDWLLLHVGRTVTAAVVVGGRVQRGAGGAAGEAGHVPIYPFGELCPCGQRGCVEAYASTVAIENRYWRVSGLDLDLAAIAGRVGRDPLADEVWGQAAAALGVALADYSMLLDPELIVLGGPLAQVSDLALGSVRQELRSRLIWREAPVLTTAALGADAALAGAAALGWSAAATA